MPHRYIPVDISDAPDLKRIAEAVRLTGQPHALKQGAETVAIVRPAPKRRSRTSAARRSSRRSRVFTANDPLWRIVGLIKDDDGANDVSSNVDKYLAYANLDTHA